MLIVSDVDDVVANTVPHWIKLFNSDWNQNLNLDKITDWDIGKFIEKEEYRKHFYEYLNYPSLYDNIEPVKNSLWGVNKLRKMGHRVIFVTSTPTGQAGRKYVWLKDHGFIDTKKNYYEGDDKSVFRGAWIIDDKFSTISSFPNRAILFECSWNRNEQWPIKAKNWKQVIQIIKSVGEFNYQ